jgi:hypothetical protein
MFHNEHAEQRHVRQPRIYYKVHASCSKSAKLQIHIQRLYLKLSTSEVELVVLLW